MRLKLNLKLIACLAAPLPILAQTADDQEPISLESFEVVTTATRTERIVTEVPVKTEVLSSNNVIFDSRTDIGQAIELLNGARAENTCQNCGSAEIQLLGLPGNYNQILVDGLPLFTGVASVYGIDQVPTIFINRIEVVKGGGSALYGPGAVAGVINLLPEEPFSSHGDVLLTFQDIDGASSTEAQFAGFLVPENGQFKASIYGVFSENDPYDRNDDGFSDLVERDHTTLGTYLWFTPTENTRITANYQYIDEERRGGDQLDVEPQFVQIAEALTTDYQWASIKLEQRINDRADFVLSAAFVDLERDSFYGGTGSEVIDPSLVTVTDETIVNGTYNGADPVEDGTPDEMRAVALFGDGNGSGGTYNQFGFTDTSSTLIDSRFTIRDLELIGSNHTLTFGIQYEEEDVRDDNINAFGGLVNVLHDDTFENIGFYIQDEWFLSEDLEITSGIRFDDANSLDDIVISPRIAVRYTANAEWTLRANFSSGFLAPRVFSEDTHVDSLAGTPVDTENSEGLSEERSYTFAAGFDFRPGVMGNRLVTSAQIYYTILDDSFDLTPPTPNPDRPGRDISERINTSGSSVLGIEVDAALDIDEYWSVNAGIAYIRSRFDDEQEFATGLFSDRYNKTPDFSGLLSVIYDNPDLFSGFLALKWTGSMDIARESPTPAIVDSGDFFVVDLGISRAFELGDRLEIVVRAGVENILDEFQDDLQVGPERESDFIYGPRAPRTYTLSGSLEF